MTVLVTHHTFALPLGQNILNFLWWTFPRDSTLWILNWVRLLSGPRRGTYDQRLTHQEWTVTQLDPISVNPGLIGEVLEKGTVFSARIHQGGWELRELPIGEWEWSQQWEQSQEGRKLCHPGNIIWAPAHWKSCLKIILRLFNNRSKPFVDASLSWVSVTCNRTVTWHCKTDYGALYYSW